MLPLLGHRLGGDAVADLLLHLRERPGRELPAILDHDEVEPAVVAGHAQETRDLPWRQREGGLLERRQHLATAEVPEVAALARRRSVGDVARHFGEALATPDPTQRRIGLRARG